MAVPYLLRRTRNISREGKLFPGRHPQGQYAPRHGTAASSCSPLSIVMLAAIVPALFWPPVGDKIKGVFKKK